MAKEQDQSRRQAPLITRRWSAIPAPQIPADPGGRPAVLDWPSWLQRIERKRRLLLRRQEISRIRMPPPYFAQATWSSFQLDGIEVTQTEVSDALALRAGQRRFRSRAAQRIRNHVAILHTVESTIRLGQPLKSSAVIRWYTSIGSGLTTTELESGRAMRLEDVVRRINSPQLRLQAALQEIARMHTELLGDPLFPGFNGILSRLLLRCHLGRCGLPFALFNGADPSNVASDFTLQLLGALDDGYELLLA